MADPIEQFRAAMAGAGLGTDDEIVADGKLHRVRGPGDGPGERDGFLVLHTDGVAAGAFGHWRLHPDPIRWHAEGTENITPQTRAAITKQVGAAKAQREKELAEQHEAAAGRAREVWAEAKDCDQDHPYLCRKRVGPHGLKESDGRLLVPVYIDGELTSIQAIDEQGGKKFARGAKAAGGSYRIGGKPDDVVIVVEGFATGASIYESMSGAVPVVIAFSAGNLLAVAQDVRKKHPKALIIVAADNDAATDGNPGIAHARKAAQAVRGRVAIPKLKGDPSAKCDFNDMAAIDGAEAVRVAFESARGLLGISAATIEILPVKWEWRDRIPRGEPTMVDGDPGIGKGFWYADLAARKSTGRDYPDGALCERGRVILVTAEDSPGTIGARLFAHEADLNQIRIIPSWFERGDGFEVLTLPDHFGDLEKAIRADKAQLLVIDPLSGVVSERVDSHRDASVRRVMAGIARLAQVTGCAIICIRHLTKQSAMANALYRGGGSIAIIGAARSGFLIGYDPTDKAPEPERKRVFAHNKANLGPKTRSLSYRIRANEGDLVAHVEWCVEPCSLSADDLLMTVPKPRDKDALQRAMDFLKLALKDGPRKSTEIEASAKDKGISKSTYNRARDELGVSAGLEARVWWLSLPGQKTTKEL
jgi:putative DNA primase/helicase